MRIRVVASTLLLSGPVAAACGERTSRTSDADADVAEAPDAWTASASGADHGSDTTNGTFWVWGDRGEAARAAGRAIGWRYYITNPGQPGAPRRDSIPEVPRDALPDVVSKAIARLEALEGFPSSCSRAFGPLGGYYELEIHPWCPMRFTHEPARSALIGVGGEVRTDRGSVRADWQWSGQCPIERDSTRRGLHLVSVGYAPPC